MTLSPQTIDELLELLAEKLAPRLAEQLTGRAAPAVDAAAEEARAGPGLISVNEFAAMLPASKSLATWRGWLYRNWRSVPGAVKIGGRLYFDPDRGAAWLAGNERPA